MTENILVNRAIVFGLECGSNSSTVSAQEIVGTRADIWSNRQTPPAVFFSSGRKYS